MKGINYLTNDKGVKTALVVDLKFYKNHVEDFLNRIKAEANRQEETISLRETAVAKIQFTEEQLARMRATSLI